MSPKPTRPGGCGSSSAMTCTAARSRSAARPAILTPTSRRSRSASPTGSALAAAVYDHIDRLRMAGREHIVRAPDYIPLRVELAICVEPGQLRHAVRDRVLAALRPGESDRPGWFHPDLREFGKDLILGDLLAFVQAIPGVRSVKALAFRALDDQSAVQVMDRI